MKLFFIAFLLSSSSMLAGSRCQHLEEKLAQVTEQLQKRTENFRELQFQKTKLEKRIHKKCVGLNKKLENAFIKSSLSGD